MLKQENDVWRQALVTEIGSAFATKDELENYLTYEYYNNDIKGFDTELKRIAQNYTTKTYVDGKIDDVTPVRGTDYWTESDIAEIKSYVDEAILGGAW